MKDVTTVKEKRLRLILDQYRRVTSAGEWITPLNPDNIKISFFDGLFSIKSFVLGNTIYLNKLKEAEDLFPCYIKELWHIKQKRQQRWKYWVYLLFNYNQIDEPAQEQYTLARNWLYE